VHRTTTQAGATSGLPPPLRAVLDDLEVALSRQPGEIGFAADRADQGGDQVFDQTGHQGRDRGTDDEGNREVDQVVLLWRGS